MLLRFRVTNHGSIRDTAELVLTKSTFEGVRPADNDWAGVTNRLAGIFGPNASGKTTFLQAMAFASDAVARSFEWSTRSKFPHFPFRLDAESAGATSGYEFDFVLHGTRHVYGFESDASGIKGEWLHSFPEGRRRVLFDRTGPLPADVQFGRHLKGESVRISRLMGEKNLYLSTAANANHDQLKPIQQWLTTHIAFATYSEKNQAGRLRAVRHWIEEEDMRRQAEKLLAFADLGIRRLSVETDEVDDDTSARIRRAVLAAAAEFGGDDRSEAEEVANSMIDQESRKIGFWHSGDGEEDYRLELDEESSGTVAWLSLAIPAVRVISNGDVFVADELDASLHPRLTAALISMFKDEKINPKGAQMIFTSHDTSLMGHLSGEVLETEDVWFTQKGPDGASEFYPLTEFSVRSDHNIERRYLSGRYGAVPAVSWEELRASLETARG